MTDRNLRMSRRACSWRLPCRGLACCMSPGRRGVECLRSAPCAFPASFSLEVWVGPAAWKPAHGVLAASFLPAVRLLLALTWFGAGFVAADCWPCARLVHAWCTPGAGLVHAWCWLGAGLVVASRRRWALPVQTKIVVRARRRLAGDVQAASRRDGSPTSDPRPMPSASAPARVSRDAGDWKAIRRRDGSPTLDPPAKPSAPLRAGGLRGITRAPVATPRRAERRRVRLTRWPVCTARRTTAARLLNRARCPRGPPCIARA